MNCTLQTISDLGILPVICVEDVSTAVPLAAALREGGVNALEVTVRNDAALKAIHVIAEAFPDMALGAGTIHSAAQADEAADAGARFLVSPGIREETIARCAELGLPIVPGCVTATEVEAAACAGLNIVKFFPSESCGGLNAMRALTGPFAGLRFIPTGGLGFENLSEYLRCDFVVACGGSFVAQADLIRRREWAAITENCRRAMRCSLGFELAHVGLNHPSEAEAAAHAADFVGLLGMELHTGESSDFCDRAVECMKTVYYGEKGHIGFYTNSVERARAWFANRQVEIREESVKRDAHGRMVSFYVGREIGGFAVHVVRRPRK